MSINMKPGIDWEKEHLVLCTKSGVWHYPVDKEKISTNRVVVEQQWGGGGYYIFKCPDYLSMKLYNIEGSFDRVCDFKNDLKEGKHVGLVSVKRYNRYNHYASDSEETTLDNDVEIRIYPDRTVSVVHSVVIDGDTIYYVNTSPDTWWYGFVWGVHRNSPLTVANLQNEHIHVVSTDDQIRSLSKTVLIKNLGKLKYGLYCDNWSDLRSQRITDNNSFYLGEFTSATRNDVETFLNCNGDANNFLRSEYYKKSGWHEMSNLRGLFIWLAIKDTPTTQAASKEEKAKILLQHFHEEWNNPEQHANEAIWGRYGDHIILALPNFLGLSRYGFGDGCKKLFAYNIKTKKSFYGEQDRDRVWSFPVPSLSYITTAMNLGRKLKNNCGFKDDEQIFVKTTIKDGLSVRELFDGTNIAWILDYTDQECQIDNMDDISHDRYDRKQEELRPVNVKDFLKENKIGTVALGMLVSTGTPLLEQLLKSKLFNLYFAALSDLENRSFRSSIVFYDDDKKHTSSSEYNRKYSNFTYHGKEKNLKKMFGLSLNALREIDKSMCFVYEKQNKYSTKPTWFRPLPTMSGMSEALGADLSNLDTETFGRCLALCKSPSRCHGSIWTTIEDALVLAGEGKMSPKQIVSLLESYQDSIGDYRDYLRMREQLANIQTVKSDIPDIFSEKRYPIKPGAAKRFLPFLNGMPNRRYSWRQTTLTEAEFIDLNQNLFCSACARGDFSVVKDENGALLGIMVSLTPEENLKYLHDDASYWVGFYQDSAKDGLFMKAIDRVKPLEWEDADAGLKIVAPTGIADLKQEGHALSHCVASYVDPIISGSENIMFLRRTDLPDDPFYTVEILNSGEIRQVHCYRNGDLTSDGQRRAFAASGYSVYDHDYDIVKFLLNWSKATKGKVKANTVKTAYGALCAIR